MEALTKADLFRIDGGETDWGDIFLGVLYATDLVCLYTRNPYVCGAALIGHGVQFFVALD